MIRGQFLLNRQRNLLLRCGQQRWKATIPKPGEALGNDGSSASKGFFKHILERYNAALMKRPLVVKASAAAVIFFVSDSATQQITDPGKAWDSARSGSGAAFGVVATGWLHYWWGFLEVFVGKRLPVTTHRLSNTLTKVFLDQAIGAPLYIYSYFVITNFIQDWKKSEETTSSELLSKTCDRATEMLPPTMLRHWTLWPAVHTVNFYYMPLHHRVLVQNLVLVGWSGYLSHLNNGGLMTPKEEVEVTETLIANL